MSLLAPEDLALADPIQPVIPLSTRIGYTATLRALQSALSVHSAVGGISRQISPPRTNPTQVKSYPCRPSLQNHIFLPPKYSQSTEVFPLYLDIHGGGYCIGTPAHDDEFCSEFSQHFNIIVVSLNYSKAPQNPYPTAVNDIAAIAEAVINDSALRIDKNRVAIGGFSAGGTLALAACQIPQLRSQVKGCCPFYPPVDLSIPPAEKLKTRAWREADKGKDFLAGAAPMFDYAYMNPGTRLRDPKISPSYAKRSDLPEWIFVIGAEFDMLCFEARVMACKFGGLEIPNGREGMSDETGLEEKYGWEREGGRVRWLMARDLIHGFATAPPGRVNEEEEKVRREKFKEIWISVGEWLFKGPFAA